MEGARISWDELTCIGYKVPDEATQTLCNDIEEFRKKSGLVERTVNEKKLYNWKILQNK